MAVRQRTIPSGAFGTACLMLLVAFGIDFESIAGEGAPHRHCTKFRAEGRSVTTERTAYLGAERCTVFLLSLPKVATLLPFTSHKDLRQLRLWERTQGTLGMSLFSRAR